MISFVILNQETLDQIMWVCKHVLVILIEKCLSEEK